MTLAAITQPEPHVEEITPDAASKHADIVILKNRLATAREFAEQAELAYGEQYKVLISAQESLRQAWESENALVIAEHARTKTYLEGVEKDLRQSVIDYCREHDAKKFDEHLSVRCLVKLEYDADQATAWAKSNAPFILVADKKAFEGIAKKQDLDFVTKVPTYSAVIASELPDLSSEGQAAE